MFYGEARKTLLNETVNHGQFFLISETQISYGEIKKY